MTRNITKVYASERQEIANMKAKKNVTRREQTANDNGIITDYKAFDPDFTCRGYPYTVGKTFEHGGKIGLCSAGTLVLAVTYDYRDKPHGGLVGRIGENGLKPDTLYTVKNGKFVEVEA